jgi:signal transduction histidine kinase
VPHLASPGKRPAILAANSCYSPLVDLTRQLAHEIQAPLLSLELQLRRLLEQSTDPEVAESCLQEVEALKKLIVHVVELGAPTVNVGTVELSPLLERVLRRFEPIAARRNVSVTLESQIDAVHGDAGAIERIVTNLVDNAVKFSPPDGNVVLTTRRHEDEVEIEVRDAGSGIAAEAQSRIFEPFFRADPELVGNGLGLAISKRLAEAQRATLRCESELGRGSAFVLTLACPPS